MGREPPGGDRTEFGPSSGRSDRREFLKLAALGAAALALPAAVSGCATFPFRHGHTLNFNEDFGVLNYAYALETLEAEFYAKAVANPPADLKPGELDILKDIGVHEAAHRRFLKRALGPFGTADAEVDLSSIDFRTRQGLLTQAQMFEDLGVAGYNGAARRLRLAEFLTIAGKIVSVEARHAAAIRNMLQPNSRYAAGAGVIDAHGKDRALPPQEVLAMTKHFFKTQFKVIGL